jgi:hypothetical protein
MKTVKLLWPLIFGAIFLSGCGSTAPKDLDGVSMQIQRGMSYRQVLGIIDGYPVQRTFRGAGTAVQFCETNVWGDTGDYAVIWMVNDVVEGLTQYSERVPTMVTDCGGRFREIDWGQAPADVKIKLDID